MGCWCVYVCGVHMHMTCCASEGQKATCRKSVLSFDCMSPRDQILSPGLAAGTFVHWAILLFIFKCVLYVCSGILAGSTWVLLFLRQSSWRKWFKIPCLVKSRTSKSNHTSTHQHADGSRKVMKVTAFLVPLSCSEICSPTFQGHATHCAEWSTVLPPEVIVDGKGKAFLSGWYQLPSWDWRDHKFD